MPLALYFHNSEPDFFTMNKNAVTLSNQKTLLPKNYKSILVEGEIGVIIKKKCKNINPKEVKNYIQGYIICNDYSGRDLINLNSDNTLLRKSSDGFLPISPAIKIGYQKENFLIKTFVNNKLLQVTSTEKLIIGIDDVISLLSNFVTLNKNDLICSGSGLPKPKVTKGDKIKITVDGLGELVSKVV